MTYYKSLFDLKVDADTGVRVRINECKASGHVQQVAYSVHHECLTQICFTCKIIRTNMPKDQAYLGLAESKSRVKLIKNEITQSMVENTKVLRLIKDDKDRFIEGKIFAYKECLRLIEAYLE